MGGFTGDPKAGGQRVAHLVPLPAEQLVAVASFLNPRPQFFSYGYNSLQFLESCLLLTPGLGLMVPPDVPRLRNLHHPLKVS